MSFKAGFLLVTLFVGSLAFPVEDVEQDMSIFFVNADSSARIVGGTNAGNVPYMVALTTGANVRNLLCGGSLVRRNRVLTAAHCVTSLPSTLRGHVGTTRFASGGHSFSFSRRVNHPNYNGGQIKNDVGILYTSSDVPLSGSVALVSINWGFVGAGVGTNAYGWGQTGTNGPVSQNLLRLSATVVDGNQCVRQVAQRSQQIGMRAPPVDPRIEICTFNSNTRGMCRGDSGSPLMRGNQQVGVVSWGLPCARGAPDMFARLSALRAFIDQNTL